jgi:uncharacterized protein (DUF169 family)
MKKLHEYGHELFQRLRLRTFPVAIKMLEDGEDIPDRSLSPKKDLGHQLAACQAFALSRREGMSLKMMKRDMWCSEAFIGYGLGDPPAYFLDGYTRYPQ